MKIKNKGYRDQAVKIYGGSITVPAEREVEVRDALVRPLDPAQLEDFKKRGVTFSKRPTGRAGTEQADAKAKADADQKG